MKFDSANIGRSYGRRLRTAQTTDLSRAEALGCMYLGPRDRLHRPCVVVVGHRLPRSPVLLDLVALLFIRLMDAIVDHDYCIVYVHTRVYVASIESPRGRGRRRPGSHAIRRAPVPTSSSADEAAAVPAGWMWSEYKRLPRKYRKSLCHVHIIHPSLALRVGLWAASPFISRHFWDRVVYADALSDLRAHFEGRAIDAALPAFVVDYDTLRDTGRHLRLPPSQGDESGAACSRGVGPECGARDAETRALLTGVPKGGGL